MSSQPLKLTFNKITNKCVGKPQTIQSPMIIMHGLFGNANNNRTMANCILDIESQTSPNLYRNIYLLNMRNHGTSPKSMAMSYDVMCQDIIKFIGDHELYRPVLVGHSMGGKVGMETVLKEPSLVSGMVVIENSPVQQPINTKFIQYIEVLQAICQDSQIKTVTQAKEKLKLVETNPLISGFLLTMLQRSSGSAGKSINQPGLTSKLPLDILKTSLEDGSISNWDVPNNMKYSGPSLFIKGSKSQYLQEDQDLTIIKQYFPRATLEIISGAGHFVNAERPSECAHAIARFLAHH